MDRFKRPILVKIPFKFGGRKSSALYLALAAAMVLSGCSGSDKSAPKDSGGPTAPTLTTTAPPTDCNAEAASGTAANANAGCAGVSDPRRHFHHYWGDPPMAEVPIFDGILEFQQDIFKGSSSCRTLGTAEFNLESDGDDAQNVPGVDPDPVNPVTGRADTVFAGTDYITVTLEALTMEAGQIPASFFLRYKPANLNFYLPENGCGTKIEVGAENSMRIPVGKGAADPPHQWYVSHWSFFALVVNDEVQGNELPTLGAGSFHLKMSAHNGGENNLDPAHPNLWGTGLTYDLGCHKEDDVQNQIIVWAPNITAIHHPPVYPLADIKWEYGRIVPLLTEKVVVTVDVTNTAPGAADWDLYYFGGDTNQYALAPGVEGSGGHKTYTILDPQGLKADPPYEDKTLWRFMILPKSVIPPIDVPATPPDLPGGLSESGERVIISAFEGSYNLCAVAHRDPDEVLQ